ncbi:MAG: penicillin-binding protein activator LpoB, partial [Acidovorax sp.]|nr:penicillin-binding protein activator LpoB [Acidovorax sp.]
MQQTTRRRAFALALAASTLALSACQNLSSPVIRFDRQVNYGDAKG